MLIAGGPLPGRSLETKGRQRLKAVHRTRDYCQLHGLLGWLRNAGTHRARACERQQTTGDERAHEDFVGSHVAFHRSGTRAELGRLLWGVCIVHYLHVHLGGVLGGSREEVRSIGVDLVRIS